MAEPVLMQAGSTIKHGPNSIWKTNDGKYFALLRRITGHWSVMKSTNSGTSWTEDLLVSNLALPQATDNAAVTVNTNNELIIVSPTFTVGSPNQWTLKWQKRNPAGAGTWSSVQNSPVLNLYGDNQIGPQHLALIPVPSTDDVFVIWADVTIISGLPRVRWYSYKLNTGTNTWTGLTNHLDISGGANPRVYGLHTHRMPAGGAYDSAGVLAVSYGNTQDVYLYGFATNTQLKIAPQPFRYPGDGISYSLEATCFTDNSFSTVSDPLEAKLHIGFTARSVSGAIDSFVLQSFDLGQADPPALTLDSTSLIYQDLEGGTLGKICLTVTSNDYLHALLQIRDPGVSGLLYPQNVFAIRSKLLPGGGWNTLDVWENLRNNDAQVRIGPHFYNTIAEETSSPALLLSTTVPDGASSLLQTPGVFFYRLPRTFSYTPFSPTPEIFPEGMDFPSPPAPPAPPPPQGPPPPPSVLQPTECPESFREVIQPERISEDSYGWVGGISALQDPEEIGDATGSYIEGFEIGGVLGLEFRPPALDPLPGNQALNLVLRSLNATSATVRVTLQTSRETSTQWVTLEEQYFDITSEFAFYVLYGDIPEDQKLDSIRALITISELEGTNPKIQLTKAAFCLCGDFIFLPGLPPTPTQDIQTPTQLPPIPGSGEAFTPGDDGEEEGSFLSPPSPPGPPLPTGAEILRPNRDVLVKLFHPRPAYMRLNEPVDRESDDPIYAPLLLERFNETNGEYRDTLRPHLELAFTDPKTNGPWEHIQLRFRAARSRPPLESAVPALPEVQCKTPAGSVCPDPITIHPTGTELDGSWQRAPLHWAIDEELENPDGCFATTMVTNPPGTPTRIIMSTPPSWEGGYRTIILRTRVRARASREDVGSRYISGFSADSHTFTNFTANMPPGAPNYEIRWNPFSCQGPVQAWKQNEKEMRGTAILQTNRDIRATLYLAAQESSYLKLEVSTDGLSYFGSLEFDLKAFTQIVIHYRIVLNVTQSTPVGNHPIGLSMQISGPEIITPQELVMWPPKAAFVISVAQGIYQPVPLTSRVRLQARPIGNFALSQQPSKTVTLTKDWNTYEFKWESYWDDHQIRDLRFEIQAQPIELTDDIANVDIDTLNSVLEFNCPGISPPIVPQDIFVREVYLEPKADVTQSNWKPVPVWTYLLGDPNLLSADYVTTDPTKPNGLMVEMVEPVLTRPVPAGYRREWRKLEVTVQADITALGSTKAVLGISHNYGAEIRTPEIQDTPKPYTVSWEFPSGLTTEQMNRLKISVKAVPILVGKNLSEMRLRVLRAKAYCEDILVASPPAPPISNPVAPTQKIEAPEEIEVYSCGSLGTCGTSPSRKVTTLVVRNIDYSGSATLDFTITGNLDHVVQGGMTQTLTQGQVKTIEVYAHVGNNSDPYPDFDYSGILEIRLTQGTSVTKKTVRWFYDGTLR